MSVHTQSTKQFPKTCRGYGWRENEKIKKVDNNRMENMGKREGRKREKQD